MATVNIGSLKFNWKGAYNGSTAYAIDDVTEYNGSSYICILASTGNLPTNTTYFQPMATKGTDGTDVGTTLTTQGDILYRDGSGLQRLAAGTNGQVLQTGGYGANPSWGTLSSDWVKIVTNDATSDVGSINWYHGVNGVVLDNTYRFYKIIGSLRPAVNGEDFRFRVGYHASGSEGLYNSGYFQEAHRSYYTGGTSREARSDCIAKSIGGTQAASEQRSNFELTLFNMSDTGLNTTAHMQYATIDGTGNSENQVNQGTSGGCYATGQATNQVRLYTGSGNIGRCEITLYGLN